LDVDEKVTVEVLYNLTSGKMLNQNIMAQILGDNSYQLLDINQSDVRQVKVVTEKSVAVTSLNFCHGQ
jgi:hypothetical protein